MEWAIPIGLLCYVMVSNDDIFFFVSTFFLFLNSIKIQMEKGGAIYFVLGSLSYPPKSISSFSKEIEL